MTVVREKPTSEDPDASSIIAKAEVEAIQNSSGEGLYRLGMDYVHSYTNASVQAYGVCLCLEPWAGIIYD